MPIKRKRKTKTNSGLLSLAEELTDREFVMATINIKVLQYSKRHKLTTWNAFMKLTEHRYFKQLMLRWFRSKRNTKQLYQKKLMLFLNSDAKLRSFYKNNIKRGSVKVKKIATTNPKYYTYIKKR
tara:strand:- start:387 stop:761 length:375 start_codon:yes stop_codon:yes gene_type:complete